MDEHTAILEMAPPAIAPAVDQGPSRNSWLAERKTKITGTDAGKILSGRGIEVWLDKRGMVTEAPEMFGYMRRGLYLERGVLQWYADTHGVGIQFAQPYTLVRVPDESLFAATLDSSRLDDGRPVDAKTISMRDLFDPERGTGWGDDGTDQIPLQYAAQLFFQMAATGAQRADLAVVFGFSGLVTFSLFWDADVAAALFDKLEDWWNRYVVTGEAPPAEGSTAFTEYLQQYVKQGSDVIRDATQDEEVLALQYFALGKEAKKVEERRGEVANMLRAAIGVNAGVRSPAVKATWKPTKDGTSTNWEQVARMVGLKYGATVSDFQAIIDDHTALVPGSRRLDVRPSKEGK